VVWLAFSWYFAIPRRKSRGSSLPTDRSSLLRDVAVAKSSDDEIFSDVTAPSHPCFTNESLLPPLAVCSFE
jgi:hypothetical protein